MSVADEKREGTAPSAVPQGSPEEGDVRVPIDAGGDTKAATADDGAGVVEAEPADVDDERARVEAAIRAGEQAAEDDFKADADKVRAEGYDILDVDSVIAAQAPKLSPYRDAMRENLARAMGVSVENVGVKATTTERLGFEGREEGISATAVCLLCRRP